jgi:hypothetical protein
VVRRLLNRCNLTECEILDEGIQMKRIHQWVFGALWLILLLPTNAAAFAVSLANPSTPIFVGDTFKLTLGGEASGVIFFTVGIRYDATVLGYVDGSLNFVGSTSDTIDPLPPDFDPAADPPLLFLALSPDLITPVDILNGPILDVSFLALAPTAPGTTTVSFEICTTDDLCGPGSTRPTFSTIDVTIQSKPSNNVPEPATLWLAAAALIAGGVLFRKDSKSS